MIEFHVIIPARYASARLPGKPLANLAGRPMIAHVHDQALASGARTVTVATDDARIAEACSEFGAQVCMTAADHVSGTDRLAECADQLGLDDQAIVVNLQGDEPMTPPGAVSLTAKALADHHDAAIATLCRPITNATELQNPNAVKVICDAQGYALYFSRAPIPWHREHFAGERATMPDGTDYYRHIGLYAYRMSFLRQYAALSVPPMERAEQLEQLRALHHGFRIHVSVFDQDFPAGVDSAGDLGRVNRLLGGEGSP